MARFDKAIQTALRLIKKNGQAVEWIEKGVIVPDDPEKPWNGGKASDVPHAVHVCFVAIESKDDLVAFRFLLNDDIQVGSTFGLMGSVGFQPTANNYVIRDGQTLNIRKLDTLKPNGVPILHLVEFVG